MTNRGKPFPKKSPRREPLYVDVPIPEVVVTPALPSPAVVYDDTELVRVRALKSVRAAGRASAAAALGMSRAVEIARAAGLSWDAIGAATDTQGETVRRRHGGGATPVS